MQEIKARKEIVIQYYDITITLGHGRLDNEKRRKNQRNEGIRREKDLIQKPLL